MRVELPIGAFIAALLMLVPLPWHWRARNIPTLSIIVWLFFCNIGAGVNAIIWADSIRIVAPVWCDIYTKIQVGATMALPACCLCLCIHLERIASVRQVGTTLQQKRRQMIFDTMMCWILPMVHMALHYIVQGHRFDILEDFGCRASIYQSVPSILLVWMLPMLVVALTLVFAGLSLVHFFRRRVTFACHLQNSNSALTTSRYFRLMAMAIVQMFWGVFIISINMWFTYRNGLRPWTSWEDVHFNFSRVGIFPTVLTPVSIQRWTYFIWWTMPITSVLFFAFFSFGQDAIKEYTACWRWVQRVIFRVRSVDGSAPNSSNIHRIALSKLDADKTYSTSGSIPDFGTKARPLSFDDVSSMSTTPTTATFSTSHHLSDPSKSSLTPQPHNMV
ncbi:pheromone A receptor-domain-containing protein [Crucibulum laeve]|uniref:Pheromone A receptor-domain-containing protein n=1 Tax=Crucibulum laeve TaxID=68775 RepID=A0A5C3LJZ0_9AGAR|nr:pheromone A receptor-domain-containing protein [Crucibulum laeve]